MLDRAFDELADYEAGFEVDAFSLYRHGADGVWRAVRTYGFGSSERDGGAGPEGGAADVAPGDAHG